jgi:hypothetical protein
MPEPMTTEPTSKTDIEHRIAALRKRIDLNLSVGNGDSANELREEIGSLYRQIELINKREREAREGKE